MIGHVKVLVADPPWLFGDKLPGKTRGAERHYPCMTTYDLCNFLRDTNVEEQLSADCILFLWRVSSMQQAALDVARNWGFTVKTDLVWLKKTVHGNRWFGMGRTLRAEHETCLVATRGRPELKNHSTRTTFVTDLDLTGFSAPVGRHSEKPDQFYRIVEALSDGPYMELFARRQREGWTTLGNELELA